MIHPSDRGSPYASGDFQHLIQETGTECSISHQEDCWEHAPVENFFQTLKTERMNHKAYKTRQEAMADIFETMEDFYNRKGRHTTLGYLRPIRFEEMVKAA